MSKVSGYGAYQQASYASSAAQKKKDEAKTNKTGSAQKSGNAQKTGTTQLSDAAKAVLKELQKKYSNMDFIVAKYETEEEASSYLSRSTKEFGVLIDPDELENMANDPEVHKQYTDQLDEAVEQLKEMKEKVQLDEGDVLHLGVSIDPYGVKNFFADIEKANSNLHAKQAANRAKTQKDFETRLAKKVEKKKADQKAAAKKTAETKAEKRAEEKKEAERLAAEKLTNGDGTVPTVQRVHVTGSTVDELLQNIQNVDWSKVPVQEQTVHGGRFDYTV
ncbi:MAG: hypothetical protein K2O34_15840 [Acetatifactor sp.]|nr:hypothetical protein [Acetatifactor sp.]